MSITVLITCYNEGAYVEEALRSVLTQTAVDEIDAIEVLDDGSGPETLAVLKGLETHDPRVRVHLFDGQGVAVNRNRGVAMATSAFIAFLDGDDYWVAEKLERQLARMRSEPSALLCYGGYMGFLDGRPDGALPVEVDDLSKRSDPARRYFLNGPSIFPSSVLVRTEAIRGLGEGFVGECTPFEDFELFFRLALQGPLLGIPEPLFHKRYRKGSLSSRSAKLMMRHAFTAFRSASFRPDLVPLAPRRIGERARRLALVHLYAGEIADARMLALTALRLQPFDPKTWASFILALGGARSAALMKRLAPSKTDLHLY